MEILDRGHEEAYDLPASPSEKADGRAEEENGLRVTSEIVAVVSASVLAGGGAGILAGVALGAINPFALGIIGVVVGTGASVPLTSLVVAREASRRPWWRRLFGAEQGDGWIGMWTRCAKSLSAAARSRKASASTTGSTASKQAGGGKRTAWRPRGCRTTFRRAEKTTGGDEERRKRPRLQWVVDVGPR